MPVCVVCNKSKPRKTYSRNQLRKPHSTCKSCSVKDSTSTFKKLIKKGRELCGTNARINVSPDYSTGDVTKKVLRLCWMSPKNIPCSLSIDNKVTCAELEWKIQKLNTKQPGTCPICFTDASGISGCYLVSCNNCCFEYCCGCYLKLFKLGKGIITCPFCRHKIGIFHPEPMLQMAINVLEANISRRRILNQYSL